MNKDSLNIVSKQTMGSLIFGGLTCLFGVLSGLLGIIFGILSLKKHKQLGVTNNYLAIMGIVISFLGSIVHSIFLYFFIIRPFLDAWLRSKM